MAIFGAMVTRATYIEYRQICSPYVKIPGYQSSYHDLFEQVGSPMEKSRGILSHAAEEALQGILSEAFQKNKGFGGLVVRYESSQNGILWETCLGKVRIIQALFGFTLY